MPKRLDTDGVAYLWSKIKNINKNNLIYYSKTTEEWNSDITYLSQPNVLYIYTDYKTIETEQGETIFLPGLKLGDGNGYLIDLDAISRILLI